MASIRFAATFAERLEAIQEFMLLRNAVAAPKQFDALMRDLERATDLIVAHPRLGRPASFLSNREPRVIATRTRFEELVSIAGGEVREYVLRGYLVLYLVRDDEIVILSIGSARERGY